MSLVLFVIVCLAAIGMGSLFYERSKMDSSGEIIGSLMIVLGALGLLAAMLIGIALICTEMGLIS